VGLAMGLPWEWDSPGSRNGSPNGSGTLPGVKTGVGVRVGVSCGCGTRGAGEKWVVFQNKSVSRMSLRPGRGGPAESHREYYEGGGLHWSPRSTCSQRIDVKARELDETGAYERRLVL
jgi:hypothetical protein